ncbi:MAG: carboxymuconolactone decarboxylase family protein [Dinoroseobacter sp.]|nr:carboxymuconolactone decarboxylase family protein [Dinoroseobacter sp.]MDJ0992000.1 carboxymuconolactone decarboxylase family protein [Dinoroseobacter sp.]
MDWPEFMTGMRSELKALNTAMPETAKGFGTLTKAAKESGAVDLKVREFVALGIAVSQRCAPCIGFHVEALAQAGGTRQELVDVLGMAVQMGGGPSYMYAAQALAAWDTLAENH